MMFLRLNVWNQCDGITSYPWALSLWLIWCYQYMNVQAPILNINTFSWRLNCWLSKQLKYFWELKSHFLCCWRSGSIEAQFTFLPMVSVAYVKGSYKSITVGCVKGFQGGVCCSVETKEYVCIKLSTVSNSESVSSQPWTWMRNSVYWDLNF